MMFFLHWGRPRHSPHYSNGAPQCLLTFIIDRQSWPNRWQRVCVCVYQLFIQLQYVGAVQAISVVIRCTTWTLQLNQKTNVSLASLKQCNSTACGCTCVHTHIHTHPHMHVQAYPQITIIKCSQATKEIWKLTGPPSLMSGFMSVQCTHAIAKGHIHTYTSTWYGSLINPLNKTTFWDSSSFAPSS